jgi:tRNA 2-selenouridine synthase
MPLVTLPAAQALDRLAGFDQVIDARSEAEFAEDHLPGAVNWPTLNDHERHVVGTEYKQVSPFMARKRGAVLAARNIAAHVERELGDTPRQWQPLVYCWRGGQRSGALGLVLSQIGFRVTVLEGGYQAFRRAVLAELDTLPARLQYRVLGGATGSGKSRLLQALRSAGAQVLDLEALANHRGSVLGLVPGSPQPAQKAFDTRVWHALRGFDPGRPVWVESESKKVGALRVPEALITRMRQSPCLRVELGAEARVALLMADYDFFVEDVPAFNERLDALRALRGNEQIDRWQAQALGGDIASVVRELLLLHYDPVYRQSTERNYAGFASAPVLTLGDASPEELLGVAQELVRT